MFLEGESSDLEMKLDGLIGEIEKARDEAENLNNGIVDVLDELYKKHEEIQDKIIKLDITIDIAEIPSLAIDLQNLTDDIERILSACDRRELK